MTLEGITAYWKHWNSGDQKGDPFFFLSLDDSSDNGKDKSGEESDKDKGDEDDNDEEKQPTPPPGHFAIDDGIPFPFLCGADGHTSCLQKLVSTSGQINKKFHELVGMVDTMEVSPIPSI